MSSPPGHEAAEPTAGVGSPGLAWLVVPIGLSLILGGATAWNSMQESLWIDELHTAWVSTGSWPQLASRAAVGNQTPIYFAWQWWLGRTFGHYEVCLRITSLLAWFGSLALLAVVIDGLVRRSSHIGLWLIVCLVVLDRQQIFFATEARPYMLMSLVVLLGWLSLSSCLAAQKLNARAVMAWLAWVACCATAMWLQPTAVLFVAAQFGLAMWHGGRQWSTQMFIAVAGAMLIGLVMPMRYVLEPAWHSRQAWAAFAADLDLVNVLKQFPILVVGVPGVIAAVVGGWWGRRVSLDDGEGGGNRRFERSVSERLTYVRLTYVSLFGWALPLLMVIGLTACGIAPLMHARYLYAATLPLTLWTASMLSRLRSGRLVTAIVCGMILLQAMQQGSVSAWSSGRLPVAQRGEQWREAVAHLQRYESEQAGSLSIFCAANLIEGRRREFLDGSALREEYLSLPLRTLYPVNDRAQMVSLLNDPRTWPEVISSHTAAESTRWLLVRTSKAGLAKRLQLSGLHPIEQFDFGAVQLVRF